MAEKAFLYLETGSRIPFQFNPSDLTLTRSASWSGPAAKGRNAPQLKFEGGQSGTVTLSLTLDATVDGSSVVDRVSTLLSLVSVAGGLPGSDPSRQSVRPAWVELHWGKLDVPFRAVVQRLQVRYTYFAADGTPLRAKVDLSLLQYDDQDVLPRQNPTSFTPAPHAVHRVLPGETLDRVAAREYGDPGRWRLIAQANGIDDPLRIPSGTSLVVPELPVRRRG
ncbi:MAG TPA: hypothetical protein VFP72_12245 [Kineosporiaceae bacterium]|nr:hypothetical protein [Kineosporiaceae bacterium]